MEFLSYPKLPSAAIALGATTPIPPDGNGSAVWSTTLGEVLFFNAGAWGRPPGNAGAANALPTIGVSTFTALPTTYGTLDKVLAVAADTGTVYYWAGFGWSIYGTGKGVDPTVAAQAQWRTTGISTTYSLNETQSDTFTITVFVPGARQSGPSGLGNGGFKIIQMTHEPDEDEREMDTVFSPVYGRCTQDNFVEFVITALPGPLRGNLNMQIGYI